MLDWCCRRSASTTQSHFISSLQTHFQTSESVVFEMTMRPLLRPVRNRNVTDNHSDLLKPKARLNTARRMSHPHNKQQGTIIQQTCHEDDGDHGGGPSVVRVCGVGCVSRMKRTYTPRKSPSSECPHRIRSSTRRSLRIAAEQKDEIKMKCTEIAQEMARH
jgi:hypothetical protein